VLIQVATLVAIRVGTNAGTREAFGIPLYLSS